MNTHAQNVIFATLASLLVFGCNEAPKKPSTVERVAANASAYVSASPTSPSATYDDAKPKAHPVMVAPKRELEGAVGEETHETEPVPKREDSPHPSGDLAVPVLDSADGITVRRLLTAPDVEHREPRAASSIFSFGEPKVVAFIEAENHSADPKILKVFFIAPSGRVTGGVDLEVPASTPRWRTWAFTRFVDELGSWRVEVRSPTGALLGSLPFDVAEGC